MAFFDEQDANIFAMACARISSLKSDEALDACLQRLRRLQKKGASKAERQQGQKDKAKARKADQWGKLLVERKAQAHFSSKEKNDFRRRARQKELARLGKKFPGVYTAEGEAKRPGADWQTPLAASFRRWAEEHSWNICQQCNRLVPKKFHPKHARGSGSGPALKRSIKACKHCSRGVGYPVPQPADVPEPLRKLPQEVLDALTIFEVHTGPWEQEHNAYRAHMAPARFSWHWKSVEERLADLESERHWEKGKEAFEWLRSAAQSSYKHFLQGHRAFLKQREAQAASGDVDIDEPIKWLPLRFMETVGLECAVWPHLYWKTEMTETWTRSQDVRRQARLQAAELSQMDWEDRILIREEEENRRRNARAPRGDSSSSESEAEADEEAEPEERKRTSAKASFVAKVFSPVMGYGACYELQHFVYDLWLASSLGGARNAASTTLRGALAGRVFSPMYWQTQHAALVDCVRQIGFPHLFITIAPLEASAPYHAWMQDELEKLLRTRTRLPAAETFHLAHLLLQTAEGLLGGTNQQAKRRRWTQHTLSGAGGEQLVLELFARLEFQDGKRRRHVGPRQSYHGSGRAHLHMLIWLSDPALLDWARILRADLPGKKEEPELRSLVDESQLDWQNSGWPLREEPTAWENGVLQLHHPASAKAAPHPGLDAGCVGRAAMPHGRSSGRWPGAAAAIRGELHQQVQRPVRNKLAERRSLRLPPGQEGALGIPSSRAGDVASAGKSRVPPSARHRRGPTAGGPGAGLGEGAGGRLVGGSLHCVQLEERGPLSAGLLAPEQQGRGKAQERSASLHRSHYELPPARRLLRPVAPAQRPLPQLRRLVGRPGDVGA